MSVRTREQRAQYYTQFNSEVEQVRVLPIGDTQEDEWGKITQTFFITGGSAMARGYVVKHEFPTTYCQHSYDCCGGYYRQSAPEVKLWNGGLHVTDIMYRNI